MGLDIYSLLAAIAVCLGIGFLVGSRYRLKTVRKNLKKTVRENFRRLTELHLQFAEIDLERLEDQLRQVKPHATSPCQTVNDIKTEVSTETGYLRAEIESALKSLPGQAPHAVLADLINLASRLARQEALLEAAEKHIEPLVGRVRQASVEVVSATELIMTATIASRAVTGQQIEEGAKLLRYLQAIKKMAPQAPVRALRFAAKLLQRTEKMCSPNI